MPIHSMLVHFPVALLLVSVLFDVLGAIRRDEKLHHAGYYTLIAGFAGTVFAVASGFFQAEEMQDRFTRLRETAGAAGGDFPAAGFPGGFPGNGFPGGDEMRMQMLQTLDVHRLLALAVLALFAVLLYWRVSQKGMLNGRTLRAYLAVAILGTGILSSAAFYGGMLGHGRRGGPDGNRQEFRMDRPAGRDLPADSGSNSGGNRLR